VSDNNLICPQCGHMGEWLTSYPLQCPRCFRAAGKCVHPITGEEMAARLHDAEVERDIFGQSHDAKSERIDETTAILEEMCEVLGGEKPGLGDAVTGKLAATVLALVREKMKALAEAETTVAEYMGTNSKLADAREHLDALCHQVDVLTGQRDEGVRKCGLLSEELHDADGRLAVLEKLLRARCEYHNLPFDTYPSTSRRHICGQVLVPCALTDDEIAALNDIDEARKVKP